ncbi:unnamed protein product, partial [Tenebrio molitor]
YLVLQLNLTSVRSTPFLEMNNAQVNNDPCNGSPNGNNLFDMKMTNRPQYVFTIKPSELMNGNIYSRLTPKLVHIFQMRENIRQWFVSSALEGYPTGD